MSLPTHRAIFSLLGLTTLILGLLWYLWARGTLPTPFGLVHWYSVDAPPQGLLQSIPSLCAGLILAAWTLAWHGVHRTLLASLLTLSLGLEFALGTADPVDALALILGFALALTLWFVLPKSTHHQLTPNRPVLGATVLSCTALTMSTGCYPDWDWDCCNDNVDRATPIYMSYAELRSSVTLEQPRPLNAIGRLYLYGNLVFLNARNEGVHVIDNTDPAAPEVVAFINLPGNTELAVVSGYLYADSFVDLVTLDIRDPDNIFEVNRQQDIFPWDPYQAIGENVWVDADPSQGVVIGYE